MLDPACYNKDAIRSVTGQRNKKKGLCFEGHMVKTVVIYYFSGYVFDRS